MERIGPRWSSRVEPDAKTRYSPSGKLSRSQYEADERRDATAMMADRHTVISRNARRVTPCHKLVEVNQGARLLQWPRPGTASCQLDWVRNGPMAVLIPASDDPKMW